MNIPRRYPRIELACELISAILDCDAACTVSDWSNLDRYRGERDNDLARRLAAIAASGRDITWGQRADGGWWVRACDHRSVSTITLHLAVRKWIADQDVTARAA